MAKKNVNKAALAASYRKGASIRDLAARHKVSYGTVHNQLSSAGVKFRSRGGPNHVKH